MENKVSGSLAKTVGKALTVLEAVSSHKNLGITEISKLVNYDISTVYRLVKTLELYGYIKQNASSSKYSLGVKVIELAHHSLNDIELRKIASPFLRDLRDQTEETSFLMVYDRGEGIYIERFDSNQSIRIASEVGTREPLHCTSCGKAILAYLPENELQKVINKGLKPLTTNTITDPDKLMKELDLIRSKGFALDNGEYDKDIICVGAPLFSSDNEVIAGISIAGPAYRVCDNKLSQYSEMVLKTANKITLILKNGYK